MYVAYIAALLAGAHLKYTYTVSKFNIMVRRHAEITSIYVYVPTDGTYSKYYI